MDTTRVIRIVAIVLVVSVLTPALTWACPICFGLEAGSDEAQSLNWAVFTLLGVTGGVLSGFVAFMFHLLKRSRQALGNDDAFDTPLPPGESGGRS